MHARTYALDSTWRPLLKDLGLVPADVLRRAGLPEGLLTQASARLEVGAFYRFWNSLVCELGERDVPLRVCQALRSEAFSPPLFAALCSPNFLVAAQRIARFKALVAPVRLSVREDADRVVLTLAWLDADKPPASLVLTELLFFVALARMGTREPLRPLKVGTTQPPAQAQPYADFLGVAIQQGTCHELVFSRSDALLPFLTSNEGLWATFEPGLRTRLAALDSSVTVGQRVRAALLEALPSAQFEMNAIAGKLAMSRRSLQRHLEAEGVSYQQVLQETRLALAQHYLHKTDMPSAEISFLLGFEEPNSFFRAFRTWTGQTPLDVRRQADSPV